MKVCPNDPSHTKFVTVAYEAHDWLVDGEGNFIEDRGSVGQVLHRPNPDNIWTCTTCGAEAITGGK